LIMDQIPDVKKEESTSILVQFFNEFLDENEFNDFKNIERLVASIRRQGITRSGYSNIRPDDCHHVIESLSNILELSYARMRSNDKLIVERFNNIVSDIREFARTIYPSQYIRATILHARVRLMCGDPSGALSISAPYATCPHLLENVTDCLDLVTIFAQAHLQLGTLDTADVSFVAFGRWVLAAANDRRPDALAAHLAKFVEFGVRKNEGGFRAYAIKRLSRLYLNQQVNRPTRQGKASAWCLRMISRFFMGALYANLTRGALNGAPFTFNRNEKAGALVTRAMGGIGDLLMMEPGLRALAMRQHGPVDFAIPGKFHAIFDGNPHVRLIDIERDTIVPHAYKKWINLSFCPAARYESAHRPHVKRGRVELFAGAMGVSRQRLKRSGWSVSQYLSETRNSFCDDFLSYRSESKKRLIGIQPFSRDSYKDYTDIDRLIDELAKENDLLLFHHLPDGLPVGPAIRTTAGVSLGDSLALVSRLDGMVSVDSAFLHAAAAFDVPVVALFGPTDGKTFTRHHKHAKILWRKDLFACVPCWRNEDIACTVTGLRSVSPCISAIQTDTVIAALNDLIDDSATG